LSSVLPTFAAKVIGEGKVGGHVADIKVSNFIPNFMFFCRLGFELRAYTLSHSTSPFFGDGFFPDRVSQTICWGWLQTIILLISAS
jgi:hypothetical protein